ncbi:MAG: WecB/TagA/CpsF family glycosyltransferase [Magnetococcales bacterium]|nr:WecB/TagA/CpsF family glycosyltransferase [Magnetococcales bacterium]
MTSGPGDPATVARHSPSTRHDPVVQTESILGFPVTRMPLDACLEQILSWSEDLAKSHYFVCANPHSLMVAEGDAGFRRAILDADLIVPDGVGISWASRLLGGSIRDRVTGTDLFMAINRALSGLPTGRCFFLGATPDTLERIRMEMEKQFPGIHVVGWYAPPFSARFDHEENERILRAIKEARPHVLWVGLTAPKQEKWIHEHRHRLDVPIIGPIGAVFDFFSGRVHRSSPFFQRLGLEWLPRLIRNPRRLWRRTVISAPRFLWKVACQRFFLFRGHIKGR